MRLSCPLRHCRRARSFARPPRWRWSGRLLRRACRKTSLRPIATDRMPRIAMMHGIAGSTTSTGTSMGRNFEVEGDDGDRRRDRSAIERAEMDADLEIDD